MKAMNENAARSSKSDVISSPKAPPLPSEEETAALESFFKMFGDATRLKILFELKSGESCVGELAERLNVTPSAISHQLKALKNMKLVKYRRDGKSLRYSLSDRHVGDITEIGLEHIRE